MKTILSFFTILFIQNANAQVKFTPQCQSQESILTLSFVGDILVHKMLYQAVVNETKNFSQLWGATDPLIRKADFSIGNLEGPTALGIDRRGKDQGDVGFIYDDNVYSGTNFKFNFHPRILENLKASGYDLLTVANNHSLDRYSIGIDRTIEASRRVGMPLVGTRHSQERNAPFYTLKDIKGQRLAFLSCTESTNGKEDSKEQLLWCYRDESKIRQLISELSRRSDIQGVIVFPHWGQEYKHVPSTSQKNLGRKFIESGAIAVVGSHPHVLQPWEKYVTADRREGIIMYSLGNFVAGQKDLSRKTGVVTYLALQKGLNGKSQIVSAGYTPTYREGTKLQPVGSGGSREVLQHAAQFFGEENRVDVRENLQSFLCKKKR